MAHSKPQRIEHTSDEAIYREIQMRLAEEPDVDTSELRIEVARGRVVLRGRVTSRGAKILIEDIVDAIPGVLDIHDELEAEHSA